MNKADEISQAIKRSVMESDRKASSYHAHAQADAELSLGGRFAQVRPTSVTGANAGSIYPKMPEGNPWAKDECPPEPPLGWSMEAQETTGEVWEVEASRSPSTSALVEGDESKGAKT